MESLPPTYWKYPVKEEIGWDIFVWGVLNTGCRAGQNRMEKAEARTT